MYQALYRKYRPQTFEDVVGQRHITDTLKAQLVSGKMSHAYLFTGTRGTGKTTCAKILAKAVNCLDSHDGNPCNQCAACRSIDNGGCVDVLEIDAASNNGVEHVRALRDEAVYSPSQVRKRVYIVDEVHMLSNSAFNALLKIIEEPPEHLLFILATTELHKVPATILSRCQRFSFRRLSAADISSRLNFVAYEEGLDLRPEAAELLSVLADGALRDGLSLLDQCASAATGSVTEETVCGVLGLAGSRKTAEMLHAVADGNASRALEIFSELYTLGKDLSALLSEMTTLARDLLVLRTAPQSGKNMLSGLATAEDRSALLQKLSAAQLLRIVTVLQRTASGFTVSADPRTDVELCLMELCSPELTLDLQSVSARVGKLEAQLASGNFTVSAAPAPTKEQAPVAPASVEQAAPVQEKAPAPAPAAQALPDGFWTEFVAAAGQNMPPHAHGFLASGGLKPRLDGGVLWLEGDDMVLRMIGDLDTTTLSEHASRLLRGAVTVKLAKKGGGTVKEGDPLQELVQFGSQHEDIFRINR